MIYGILDVRTHHLRYVLAGHPGPVLAPAAGEPRLLHATGFPIGMFAGADYSDIDLELQAGDRLFLYSDGILEAVNPSGEQFGSERLRQAIQKRPLDTVEECSKDLLAEVLAWSSDHPDDDLSILALAID
jgi:sigma-B regulation protein RsbU (phosphoserine phosphatase)